MRPDTLAEAVERIRSGAPQDAALAEFVDTFHSARNADDRYETIKLEPAPASDVRLNALVAAMAEYLAKQYRLGRVPAWVSCPSRRLSQPWFTASSASNALREYLTFASPAEFASRNIFTDEQPLRRARALHPKPERTT
jgi:hypothetical protein